MNEMNLQELSSLFFSVRQIIRSKLPDAGTDPNAWLRYETMQFIARAGEPTMRDVAYHLHIKAPSATSLVGHLVKRGLVRRSAGKDKRVTRLHLSAKGERARTAHQRRSAAVLHEVFSRCSKKDIAELSRVLHRIRDIHDRRE